uniref:Acetyl-coenzyme A carboxylase carboxyl transferase subunit beta n=1 Tax=Cyanidium sp. THAL103 TaxID=3027999 RepID=A0A9Y1I460_9RHOD|nr:acetyl-CoA carboxylase beta subunit [Cyanidium sp. THAL103]
MISYKTMNRNSLWIKCELCKTLHYINDLIKEKKVCHVCKNHLYMSSKERIASLCDENSWLEINPHIISNDPLGFKDQKSYILRLEEAKRITGLKEAVQTGIAKIFNIDIGMAIMDFSFMGGSMGAVVGEKIARLIDLCVKNNYPLIILSASGGARMQEGVISLMQMAKISAALQKLHESKQLYISVLTSPTTGGVMASFATLGDIILAEPKATVGFAGKRVIQQTLKEEYPTNFQSSEFAFNNGFIDLIIDRRVLKNTLHKILKFHRY